MPVHLSVLVIATFVLKQPCLISMEISSSWFWAVKFWPSRVKGQTFCLEKKMPQRIVDIGSNNIGVYLLSADTIYLLRHKTGEIINKQRTVLSDFTPTYNIRAQGLGVSKTKIIVPHGSLGFSVFTNTLNPLGRETVTSPESLKKFPVLTDAVFLNSNQIAFTIDSNSEGSSSSSDVNHTDDEETSPPFEGFIKYDLKKRKILEWSKVDTNIEGLFRPKIQFDSNSGLLLVNSSNSIIYYDNKTLWKDTWAVPTNRVFSNLEKLSPNGRLFWEKSYAFGCGRYQGPDANGNMKARMGSFILFR